MKRLFQGRTKREQWLVTVLVLGAALAWLDTALRRVRTAGGDFRTASAAAATQQLWLDRQGEIEAAAAKAVGNLDPARTHDATRLVTTVTTLATGAGLQPSIDPPQTNRTPQFAYHSIKVTIRRAQLPALLRFYDELAKQTPYLNLEQISVQTERANTGQLTAVLQVSSTQIAKPSSG